MRLYQFMCEFILITMTFGRKWETLYESNLVSFFGKICQRLIRVKLSFLVLRASLLCLRGSRSLNNNDTGEACEDFALTLHEVGLR